MPPKIFIVVKWMIKKKNAIEIVLIANGNVTEFEINATPFLNIFHGRLTVAIE